MKDWTYDEVLEMMEKAKLSDSHRLKFLNLVYKNPMMSGLGWCRVDERIAMRVLIERCAENGEVAVVESGMDCDCVQYDGVVRIIPANLRALDKLHDHIADSADGPFHLAVMRPSEAKAIKYRSRDRALEAFEDGHPHVVYVGSLED